MALTSCDECKAEISDQAEACPRCGAKQASAARGRRILFGLIVFAAIALISRCNHQEIAQISPIATPQAPISSAPSIQRAPEVTDHALAVCNSLKNTGATECELSVFSQAIDARINVSAADAGTLCTGIAGLVRKQTTAFNGTAWQIRIFSPFSGDHPLASCSISQSAP